MVLLAGDEQQRGTVLAVVTHVSWCPGLKLAISPYTQTQLPGAAIAYRAHAALESSALNVLAKA